MAQELNTPCQTLEPEVDQAVAIITPRIETVAPW